MFNRQGGWDVVNENVQIGDDMTVGQLRAAYNALGVVRCTARSTARMSDRAYLSWEVRLRFADRRDVVGDGVDVLGALMSAVRKATVARGA